MILFESSFIIFTILIIFLYYTFLKNYQWQLLLVGSLFFYYYFTKSNFIIFSIVNTFLFALLIERVENKSVRKFLLLACLIINFGLLFLIKYSNFFISKYGILIPLGISFYMFQSISYVIDVYRGSYKADRNIFKFALFISYFPQIIQGPIGRYNKLAPQMFKRHEYDSDAFRYGFETICWGAFKKIFVADRIATFVNTVFSSYDSYYGAVIFLAVFAYSIQIYTDFSGGIDIVRGISQILGIELDVNFRRPFFANSVSDFWRRWHITLSAWMKDYVFYSLNLSKPLAFINKKARKLLGNKKGKLISVSISTYILYFIVGIWHGAGSNYVFYGLWNGTIISLSLYFESYFKKVKKQLKIDNYANWFMVFQVLRTNVLVTLGRYFSRADSAGTAFAMLKRTFLNFSFADIKLATLYDMGYTSGGILLLILCIIIVLLVDWAFERKINLYRKFDEAGTFIQLLVIGLFVLLMVFGVIYAEGYVSTEFIYRQY
ncbi:MBOAT family O-acyltransferase [Anaerosphaera multitolerans]|uniref:MBOAT family protein n=1 Tax=Anaerosphaera multitolerans TaxID=2487351 RepID=A0A437S6Y9_9FIRM|nr:MBOAT family O-acyltransferase [Anaerosphaera multitolerans]RVU54810.1 MBOAT family protein [Anaerosphaera multitolerans]